MRSIERAIVPIKMEKELNLNPMGMPLLDYLVC